MNTGTPVWEELELQRIENGGQLELCLLWKGKLHGYAHAKLDAGIWQLQARPTGAAWAVDLLQEALEEWRLCREQHRIRHAV